MNIERKDYSDYKISDIMKIKNSYGFRVTLIFYDGSEVVQQKSGYKSTKEARTARDKTVSELYSHTYVVDIIGVKDFFEYWLEKVIKVECTGQTYMTYGYTIKNWILPVIGKMKLAYVNRSHIIKMYNKVSEVSYSAAQMCRCVAIGGFKYALNKNLISSDPTLDIELTKEKNENKVPYKTIDIDSDKTLSEDQLLQLFNHCKESKVYLHVLFAGLLGLRKSEIIGLKYSDINYDDCTIHVQRQLGRDFSRDEEVAEPKTITKNEIHLKTFSSERILPIPDMIFDAVMKERKKYEARRSRRKKSFQDKGYICCSSYGRPRSPSFVYAPFKQALKECGLPDIRFHDLRHSYATMLLKHDFDVKAVSVLLGHANTIITVDTYGDKKKIIEDCVDDILPFIDYVLSDYCIPSNEQKFVGDHSDVEISLDFINELFPGEDYNNEENESETVTFSVDELYSSN